MNIPFYLLLGQAKDQLPIFVRQNNIGCVVCDFSPLKIALIWLEEMKKQLPQNVLFAQVDSHNIVPLWVCSDKKEEAAYTIRPKINAHIDEFLTEFPPVMRHPFSSASKPLLNLNNKDNELKHVVNLDDIYPLLEVDKSVKEVKWCKPGYQAGIQMLQDFILNRNRLRLYDTKRNEPNMKVQSFMSPWFHFGQISPQRAILETQKYLEEFAEAVQWFYDATVIRRELGDNFCYYEKNYDNINGGK